MDKELLKKKLNEQINAMDDEMALKMLHEAAAEYGKTKNILDDLTPEHMARLEKSLEIAQNDNTVSNEEAMKRFKEWHTK
jgi:hypothetical protein